MCTHNPKPESTVYCTRMAVSTGYARQYKAGWAVQTQMESTKHKEAGQWIVKPVRK